MFEPQFSYLFLTSIKFYLSIFNRGSSTISFEVILIIRDHTCTTTLYSLAANNYKTSECYYYQRVESQIISGYSVLVSHEIDNNWGEKW